MLPLPFKYELLIDLLREVNRGIGKYVKDVIAEHDLSITMVIITRQIGKQPGITISELARRTGIAKSHISTIIREMQQKSWVDKKTDPADQRLSRLHLTEAGCEYLGVVRMDIKERVNTLVSTLPEQRARDLIKGLEDIKAILESAEQRKCN